MKGRTNATEKCVRTKGAPQYLRFWCWREGDGRWSYHFTVMLNVMATLGCEEGVFATEQGARETGIRKMRAEIEPYVIGGDDAKLVREFFAEAPAQETQLLFLLQILTL